MLSFPYLFIVLVDLVQSVFIPGRGCGSLTPITTLGHAKEFHELPHNRRTCVLIRGTEAKNQMRGLALKPGKIVLFGPNTNKK